jgi:hypothetical protein
MTRGFRPDMDGQPAGVCTRDPQYCVQIAPHQQLHVRCARLADFIFQMYVAPVSYCFGGGPFIWQRGAAGFDARSAQIVEDHLAAGNVLEDRVGIDEIKPSEIWRGQS